MHDGLSVETSDDDGHPERTPDTPGPVAIRILERGGEGSLIYVSGSERRAEELWGILRALAPEREIMFFPAWDCLPYDRVSPSREVMGRRASVLRHLAERPDGGRIIVTTPAAIHQRVPPRDVWADACLLLAAGKSMSLERFRVFLDRCGYFVDSRVDEPGEVAIRSSVIDIYPAAEAFPYRIEHDEQRIVAIRCYDPVTQRTLGEVDTLLLQPASEVILPEPNGDGQNEPFPGIEHWLPRYYPQLENLLDYAPDATLMIEPKAESRLPELRQLVNDAYEARARTRHEHKDLPGPHQPVSPEELYLEHEEWQELVSRRAIGSVHAGEATKPVPRFALDANPARRFGDFAAEKLAAGHRVVLAAASDRDAATLARQAQRRLERTPEPAPHWKGILDMPVSTVCAIQVDLRSGFVLDDRRVTVICAADVLGTRAESGSRRTTADADLLTGEIGFQIGDAVIEMDHGMAALRGLETITAGETTVADAVRLEYAGQTKLKVPIDAIDRIWRYGANADAVSLDRLGGEAWPKRRAKVEDELRQTAAKLCKMAEERSAVAAPKLVPPRRAYERFAARFPFSETADQESAIKATLEDLASGRLMDRLVCGDVGFGKTEVALRAAAAAAFAGSQVALVAPTTVLARQHFNNVRRRFAGSDIEVAHLSRLVKPDEARNVRDGIASGRIHVVVGTHALAAKGIRFKNLGLLIIDEEQRFGAREKERLRELGRRVHLLTLAATPIPRTLQAALVGIQDLSIIATPPDRRQPVRTVLMPWDAATLGGALTREKRRGGQSFVVCPRVEDIEGMRERLAEIVPELDVKVAHGRLRPEAIDAVMLDFAEGRGDVLLATNIIESGLDLPRVNTIAIWRADRFGLAQLHQLRGRVGRSHMRATAYLLTDPAKRMAKKTEERLRSFQALDRLGAGFAISARDLDARGAGDLFGKEQAGHLKLIGIELYQHLFERALRAARGERLDEEMQPELHFGATGRIPEAYVPEPEVRINLYARLAKLQDTNAIESFAQELDDRFGPLPAPVDQLLMIARSRRMCRQLGISRVDAGPRGIALSFRQGAEPCSVKVLDLSGLDAEWREGRLVVPHSGDDPAEQTRAAIGLIERLIDLLGEMRPAKTSSSR